MTEYARFKELHNQDHPLIMANAWNVQSARVFEKLNYQAIGTSSAAIASSLGYEDGEQMPFSALLYVAERIGKNITLPFSVDIEFGYGKTATEVANNIIALHELGVAGINIEDSFIENGKRKLTGSPFSQLLKEVKCLLLRKSISMFINVRCDTFLLNIPNLLKVSTERIRNYEQAGADGIFLPCITRESDIAEITSQTKLPLNVLCMPQLPDFETLKKAGVKRISMGSFLNASVYKVLENEAANILNERSFKLLF